MEPLPGLVVTVGLTDQQVVDLAAAVHGGAQPRVQVLPGAGQVAGRRGCVVAVDDPRTVGPECIRVQLRGNGDVLPFAPHELTLTTRSVGGARHAAAAAAEGTRAATRRGTAPALARTITAPRPGWTLDRALDLLAKGHPPEQVAELSGYGETFLQAHRQARQRRR